MVIDILSFLLGIIVGMVIMFFMLTLISIKALDNKRNSNSEVQIIDDDEYM